MNDRAAIAVRYGKNGKTWQAEQVYGGLFGPGPDPAELRAWVADETELDRRVAAAFLGTGRCLRGTPDQRRNSRSPGTPGDSSCPPCRIAQPQGCALPSSCSPESGWIRYATTPGWQLASWSGPRRLAGPPTGPRVTSPQPGTSSRSDTPLRRSGKSRPYWRTSQDHHQLTRRRHPCLAPRLQQR